MYKPTLKTIADHMKLSVSAVSRILNNKGHEIKIAPDTIARTLQYAHEIGYRPHLQAQNLRLGKSNLLGACLILGPDIGDLHFCIMRGMFNASNRHSQSLIFFGLNDASEFGAALDHCLSNNIDGLVVSHVADQKSLDRLNELYHQGMRIVMILDSWHSFEGPTVGVDQVRGGFLATEHLIAAGHRRIGHLGNFRTPGSGYGREAGYRQALAAYGIPYHPELTAESNEHNGFVGVEKLLALPEPPTAIFCWNDKSAIRTLRTLHTLGLNIEVVGFDNRPFLQFMEFQFSTIDGRMEELGETAVEVLLNDTKSQREILLEPKLVVRN